MVRKKHDSDVDFDVTNEENTDTEEITLEDIEERGADKIKQLRDKLRAVEEEKSALMDELQRTRADFLNAKKRLEEDKLRDRVRSKMQHVESLLPLCDSFQMAMSDKKAWEEAPKSWRTGIEGIYNQLRNVLKEANVTVVNPEGEAFNPSRHEAVSTKTVADKSLDDTVVSVIQSGYEITDNEKTEIIRPARVVIGQYEE